MRHLFIVSLVLLSACASSRPIEVHTTADSAVLANAESVEIRLANFSFKPSDIHLKAGRAYRLVLFNETSGGHSFAAPDFFESAQIAPADADKVSDGTIDIAGNATETVVLIPTTGTYDLVCGHFGHAALGMTGELVVD
ncbi:cupredoxin domain-containing protein [Croceicoccus ponticola]|nr:cupredoxin domain-containing protein [Croceicoccus ponticola]